MKKHYYLLTLLFTLLMVSTSKGQSFSGSGAGTSSDPYVITNASQLREIDNFLNDSSVHFELGSDIDLSTYSNWNPIGDDTNTFAGHFNGNNNTITGLQINNTTPVTDPIPTRYTGLFATSEGTIENITLTSVNVTGQYNVGGLVGESSAAGNIINVSVSGTVNGEQNVGGIVGMNLGTIHTSSASAHVEISTGSGSNAGGLVGRVGAYSAAGTVQQSHATGDVVAEQNSGGLVGMLNNGSVLKSYATGAVTSGFTAGGLVGLVMNGNITQSFATGNVTSSYDVGGLVGINQDKITQSYAVGNVTATQPGVGGLVGTNEAGGTVDESYSAGFVDGNENKDERGGLVGDDKASAGAITDSFWDTNTSGYTTSAGGSGKTTAEMTSLVASAGWNSSVWDQPSGHYPKLQPIPYDDSFDMAAPSAPAANIPGGTYNSDQMIMLSGESGASIYYTRDGSTPTTGSMAYTGPITINSTTTLKAIAEDDAGNTSPVLTETYRMPEIIYVDADATGANDGTSWTNAYTSLQDALDEATGSDEIWIAEGTYYPDEGSNVTQGDATAYFTITGAQDGLKIYGGFDGTESLLSERDISGHATILSGDIDGNDTKTNGVTMDADDINGTNSNHVLFLDAGNYHNAGSDIVPNITTDTKLDGLIITGGQADGNDSDRYGGGLFCDGLGSDNECSPALLNVIFAGNLSVRNGGAILNSGPYYGNSNPVIANSIFTGNQAHTGGAIYNSSTNLILTNVDFISNSANYGGALYYESPSIETMSTAINNTVFYNNTASSDGNHILNDGEELSVTINHSLLENGTDGIENIEIGTIIYADENGNSVSFANSTNIDANPQFVDTSNPAGADGDWFTSDDGLTMQASSPAINTGDNNAIPSGINTDIAGTTRTQGPIVDMGAYESSIVNTTPSISNPITNITVDEDAATDSYDLTNVFSDTEDNSSDLTFSVQSNDNTGMVNASVDNSSDQLTLDYLANQSGTANITIRAEDSGGETVDNDFEVSVNPVAETFYVDAGASSSGDGSSWGSAFQYLQDALDAAGGEDEIWIAEGTYYPDEGANVTNGDETVSFTITGTQDGLKVYGGFDGTESQLDERDISGNQTILSGDIDQDDDPFAPNTDSDNDPNTFSGTDHISGINSNHVLYIENNTTKGTSVDALTISSGQGSRGGGIYVRESDITLNYLRLTGNTGNYLGAAISNYNSSLTITNSIFSGNQSDNDGGGIYNDVGDTISLTITNTIFTNNAAKSRSGGAIFSKASSAGGKIESTITNTIFVNNSADRNGGAINNWGEQGGTDGIVNSNITNTIFYGNTAPVNGKQIFNDGAEVSQTISHSLIEGETGDITQYNGAETIYSDENGNSVSFANSTNIDANPRFVDASNPAGADGTWFTDDDGFVLQPSSPAVGAGDNDAILSGITTDIAGNQRIRGGTVDMGAYEAEPISQPDKIVLTAPEDKAENILVTPTLEWESQSEVDAYEVQLASGSSFEKDEVIISETGISETNFQIDNKLDREATYYWRVRGTNAGGNGEWSSKYQFTTIPTLPVRVELTYPDDGSGSISVDDVLTWQPGENADTYSLEIAVDEAFSDIVVSEDKLSDTQYSIDGQLKANTTYFWRVQASNSAGRGEWSDIFNFTSIAAPPVLSFPAGREDGISIAPRLSWQSEYSNSLYRVKVAVDNELQSLVADTLVADRYLDLEGLDPETEYYWQVRIESDHTTSAYSSLRQFITRTPPQEDTPEQQISFGNSNSDAGGSGRDLEANDYRLIGLPGSEDTPVEELFEGEYGKDWKVFADNGEQQDFWVEHSNDNPLTFTEGRGFWILSKKPLPVGGDIEQVQISEEDTYSIILKPGWNIISNPFTRVVDWQQVQDFNSQNLALFGYDGSFYESDVMDPFFAYYLFNEADEDISLNIPFTSLDKKRDKESQKQSSQNKITSEPGRISLNIAIENRERPVDLHLVYDTDPERRKAETQFMPPLELSKFGAAIIDNDSPKRKKMLQTVGDVLDRERKNYTIEVKAHKKKKTEWTPAISGFDTEMAVLVVEPGKGRTKILSDGESYAFMTARGRKQFEVYTGTVSELKKVEDSLLPQQIALNQNYPNPFNPTTTIRYGLDQRDEVQLEVFDILGRKVRTLVNETRTAGWYEVNFDGRRLASGTYFYRLIIGQSVKTRKMVLIK